MTMWRPLHFLFGKIERDCPDTGSLPILEVAIEAGGDIDAGHDDHPGVEDAGPATQAGRVPHAVLQGKDDPDALEREDGCNLVNNNKVKHRLS